jgi:hypothetical protein
VIILKRWLMIVPILVMGWSCTRNLSEVKTLSISGAVKLSGEADLAGITVALYPVAEIDTVLANMYAKFPSVGIPQTQAAFFDHRKAEAAYKTLTDVDGFYNFSKIPQTKYNLVAEKKGFGWRYIYEISEDGVVPDVVLYPELRLSGTLDAYTVWSANHHIVIANDVMVPDGGMLLIDKGAVVRFEGYNKLIVNGQLTTIGTADEMVWFTTNVLDKQNAANWQSLEIVGNSTISFARFDHADMGVYNKGAQSSYSQSVFRDIRDRGILAGNESDVEISGCLFFGCKTAIQVETGSKGAIHHNLISNLPAENSDGKGIVSNNSTSVISDNGISYCAVGSSIEYAGSADFMHNFITACPIGVYVVSLIKEISTVQIVLNTITNCANASINIQDNATPLIENNNLIQDEKGYFIRTYSLKYLTYENIEAKNNYFANTAVEAMRRIEDKRTNLSGITGSWEIIIDPVSAIPFSDAIPR